MGERHIATGSPLLLSAVEARMFRSILSELPLVTAYTRSRAASLAKLSVRVDQLTSDLVREPATITNPSGRVVANPKNQALAVLSRQARMLRRELLPAERGKAERQTASTERIAMRRYLEKFFAENELIAPPITEDDWQRTISHCLQLQREGKFDGGNGRKRRSGGDDGDETA